jgi:hypothetical protein
MSKYPIEVLDSDHDDGTMVENVAALANEVVGHKIIDVKRINDFEENESGNNWYGSQALQITLDNGKTVYLQDTDDCCAYTSLKSFLFNVDKINHVITGVGTTDKYETWHIYADYGDVLAINLAWSSGNPFYYAYGFNIIVREKLND